MVKPGERTQVDIDVINDGKLFFYPEEQVFIYLINQGFEVLQEPTMFILDSISPVSNELKGNSL